MNCREILFQIQRYEREFSQQKGRKKRKILTTVANWFV